MYATPTKKSSRISIWLATVSIASLLLWFLYVGFANAAAQPNSLATATTQPFWRVVPSANGSDLYIEVANTPYLTEVLTIHLVGEFDNGPSNYEKSYAPVYSDTGQIYLATASGLTPQVGFEGTIELSTTADIPLTAVSINRRFVPANATSWQLLSKDAQFRLQNHAGAPFATDAYLALAENVYPPAETDLTASIISKFYTVHPSGLLTETERPFVVDLQYDAEALGSATPFQLDILAWDEVNQQWVAQNGRLLPNGTLNQYSLVTTSRRFTTFALALVPRWHDDFIDTAGLQSRSNLTLAFANGVVENLTLTSNATSGTALSHPITPTLNRLEWGTLTFNTLTTANSGVTVDIVSPSGELLLPNVASGTDLSQLLNATNHRAIQLQVNMTRTLSTDPAPQLLDWDISWHEAPEQTDKITGWLDTAICQEMRGWTGEIDAANQPLDVHIYEGPAATGTLLANIPANLPSETAVCTHLNGSNCDVCPTNQPQCQHRYRWEVPAALKDGRSHNIYAYGVNPITGRHNQLLGTPRRFTCPLTTPHFESIWNTNQNRNNTATAVGDFDGDGDLDLAFGNSDAHPIELYRNDNGTFTLIPSPTEPDRTLDLAWGDFDGDGDLDLAVGNGTLDEPNNSHNRIYRNDGLDANGNPSLTLIWTSAESELTSSVAWGDVDNDGILELAVGSGKLETILEVVNIPAGHPNRLYRYTTAPDGSPTFQSVWESAEADLTLDVAWADVNGDGLLDLAAANAALNRDCELTTCETTSLGQQNRLYMNDNGMLLPTAVWSSTEADPSSSLAWGDYDDDGDPDLAVGNFNAYAKASLKWTGLETTGYAQGHANRIYRNDNGTLTSQASWSSDDTDATVDVAWGDYDNDGDLDLAAANTATTLGAVPSPADYRNRIYRNEGWEMGKTAVWSSPEAEFSLDTAWADLDNDGDLDLVVANGDFDQGQPSRTYRNDSVALGDSAAWSSTARANSFAIVWADIDSNGSLDLLVGNGGRAISQTNRFYRNLAGQLLADDLAWPNLISDTTTSLAVADIDGDFDLDLVVGNNDQPNRLYRNENGVLLPDPTWEVTAPGTTAVAWADIDNDGDLDLAISSRFTPLAIYPNHNGTLSTTPLWQAPVIRDIWTIAFGDVDGDGYVDMAVGSRSPNDPIRLYQNLGMGVNGVLQLVENWQSVEKDATYALAWGDIDQDGYLDLAVGNDSGPNRVYTNVNGRLQTTAVWSSHESDVTHSIALGDYDGDGDLDLAAGNRLQSNRLYRNEGGMLGETAVWSSAETDATTSVAWGDVDNDGDLDLIAANNGNPLRLYLNPRHSHSTPVNDPPFAAIDRPGFTPEANFFATAERLQGSVITITYTLFDDEGDQVPRLFPEYSPDGGGHWLPATAVTPTQLLNLATSPWPQGVDHIFHWQAEADLIKSDNVAFRLRPLPTPQASPILWGAIGSNSAPFRLEAPWYIQVTDENGRPIPNIPIYANGQPITHTLNNTPVTNIAGLLNPGTLPPGTALTALAPQAKAPTLRPDHDQWAYQTYLTNVTWDSDDPTFFAATASGRQHLVVRQRNPLILFNLVVSLEWNATATYLAEIEAAFKQASHYLYDATDGQMAFGQLLIGDAQHYWESADIQIMVDNSVRPNAYIGQLLTGHPAYIIRVGRGWDGNSGAHGSWAEKNGYRTLIHEFAHYGLHLYDEYVQQDGRTAAYCTSWELQEANDAVNASIMYRQYIATEFAMRGVGGLWEPVCEYTLQWYMHGKSDWETIAQQYDDPHNRWRLFTPQDRGHVFPGPQWPANILPEFPVTTIINPNPGQPVRHLTVIGSTPGSTNNLRVTLEKSTRTFDQGLTDKQGEIELYGAAPGDLVRVQGHNGLTGSVRVTESLSLTLTLGTNGRLSSPATPIPTMRLWPSSTPYDGATTLTLTLNNFSDNPPPYAWLRRPSTTDNTVLPIGLAYSPETGQHTGSVTLSAIQQGVGQVGASNVGVPYVAPYRLQQIAANTISDVFSHDGRLHLFLNSNSLSSHTNLLILSPPTVPELPSNQPTIHGRIYDITASGALTEFAQPTVLTLAYHDLSPEERANLAMYWWNAQTAQWEMVPSTLDEEQQQLTAVITNLGTYALMITN